MLPGVLCAAWLMHQECPPDCANCEESEVNSLASLNSVATCITVKHVHKQAVKGMFGGHESTLLWCSADGVSMAAQYAELIAYSITLAYNLRHSALPPHLDVSHAAL